jgi:hypothetical protein
MPAENNPAVSDISSLHRDDALHLGPRKKLYALSAFLATFFFTTLARCISNPLIGHSRHFCRTVHALCNIKALLTNGLLLLGEQADEADEAFAAEYVHSS